MVWGNMSESETVMVLGTVISASFFVVFFFAYKTFYFSNPDKK
jgi:hypothetical protein